MNDALSYSGTWERFAIRDGLPDMKIESFCEDSTGVLWIGTHSRGVIRYDRDEFRCFTTRDGLAGNGVFAVCEDDAGNLLLATDRGLTKWSEGVFEAVGGTVGVQYLWGAARDLRGLVWIGERQRASLPAAVWRWDGAMAVRVDLEGSANGAGKSIHSVVVDRRGTVWCGGHGLFAIDQDGARVVLGDRSELADIHTMAAPAEDAVVIATASGTFALVGDELRELRGIPSPIEGLAVGPDGATWACTRDGKVLRIMADKVEHIGDRGLPLWRAVGFDRTGILWVGSFGFGLFSYDASRFAVTDSSRGLPDSKVQAVCCAGSQVWIGTPQGVISWDGLTRSGIPGKPQEYASENVTALLSDRKGRLWIGKRNGTLYVLDNGVMTQCVVGTGLSGHTIDSIAEGEDGCVWVGSSFWGGALRYGSPAVVESFELGGTLPEAGGVGAIAVGPNGSIYFGSATPEVWEGIIVFDGKDFGSEVGIGHLPVTALCFDGSGRAWVGTTEGVMVCDGDYVLAYGIEDGLPSELISSLYADSKGRIWIGTEGGGICLYDGQVFQTVELEDRLFCNTVNCICEDANGDVWIGTNGGLVRRRFKPGKVVVEVHEIIADTAYPAPGAVQFPDTVGRITIALRGASAIDRSSQLAYRFRLKGYETDWRQTRERQVDYPRLAAGEYEFVVQAIDRDLNYSKPETVKLAVIADPRIDALNRALRSESVGGEFVGESNAMQDVLVQISEVAWTDLTVLVLGETGTGKGLAARQIHELSERRDGPFIHVNCGSLQEGLVDSELFGHERGAFTGAVSRRLGKFELAQAGTIFLDEIGDLPMESQARLLKVLQDKTIERVGGTQTITVDVRVIAATNRNLAEAVREQRYRADLYYRLNVFPLRLPLLRERREDTVRLAEHFVGAFAAHLNQRPPELTPEALSLLLSYDWPGNVRELEHTLQRAVILARDGHITPSHLGIGSSREKEAAGEMPILPLAEYERRYFRRVLAHTGGVIHGKNGAARLLEMKPTTLRSRLEKLGIQNRRHRAAAE